MSCAETELLSLSPVAGLSDADSEEPDSEFLRRARGAAVAGDKGYLHYFVIGIAGLRARAPSSEPNPELVGRTTGIVAHATVSVHCKLL